MSSQPQVHLPPSKPTKEFALRGRRVQCVDCLRQGANGRRNLQFLSNSVIRSSLYIVRVLYRRGEGQQHREGILHIYVEGPSPLQSRLCGCSYLIKFSIRNLSYSPSSEPSQTVLLPDVMYTMYARRPS